MTSVHFPDLWCVFQFVGRVRFQENKSPFHASTVNALIISTSNLSSAGAWVCTYCVGALWSGWCPSALQAARVTLAPEFNGEDIKGHRV